MIDLAIRHYVIDYCFDLVFEKFKTNLMISSNGLPSPGQYFSRISHISSEEHYYGCYITDVERKSSNGDDFYIVYFVYERSDGKDLDEWLKEMDEIDQLYSDRDGGIIETDDLELLNDIEQDMLDTDDSDIELYQLDDDEVGVNAYYYVFVP